MATQAPGRELSNREFFIQRWEREYPTFVRVFKALPANGLDYRPHPRSRSAGELVALLVASQKSCIELCKNLKSSRERVWLSIGQWNILMVLVE